jgi:ABC-type branched-subunit amino acid transport system ATPase component
VLAEGTALVSGSFAEVTGDRRVIDAYLGVAL